MRRRVLVGMCSGEWCVVGSLLGLPWRGATEYAAKGWVGTAAVVKGASVCTSAVLLGAFASVIVKADLSAAGERACALGASRAGPWPFGWPAGI